MWSTKLQAGALQVTIGIVTVIALLLFSFVLLVHSHKLFRLKTQTLIQTLHQTHYGLDTFLDHQNQIASLESESYSVKQSFWGLYKTVQTKAQQNTYKATSYALVGSKQPKMRTSLYLEDHNQPLVLVGNTHIKGKAYLPERGVKPGSISGEYYTGSQLIYGSQDLATTLPVIDKDLLDHLTHLKNNSVLPLLNTHGTQLQTTLHHSFRETTKIIYNPNSIVLAEHELIGNIIICSDRKITVSQMAKLKDVILIAPDIEIKDHVQGQFQAIASAHIQVGKSVNLSYPSALVLIEKQPPGLQATTQDVSHFIRMDTKSNISGQVVFIGQDPNNTHKAQIYIAKDASITGELYCNQNTELLGAVYGSVFTSYFVAKQTGSVYQNHIYNGTISITDLPENYVGLLFNNSKKGIAQWLY